MRKLKIVFVGPEVLPIPPVKGGAVEKTIYEISKELKKDNSVYVLSIHDSHLDAIKSDEEGRFIFNFKKGILSKILLCTYKLPFKQERSTLYYLPYSLWCGLMARRLGADIIHVHTRVQFIPILRYLNPTAKIVLHFHNVCNFAYSSSLCNKALFDKVDLFLACSDYLKDEVIRMHPHIKDKVKRIYHGVNMKEFCIDKNSVEKREEFGIGKDDIVLVFVGRLVEYKGVHVLIDAFNLIADKYQNLKLFIIGGKGFNKYDETPYIRSLKNAARDRKRRIAFTNYIDHKHIPAYIGVSDIFVVPSLWEEPFGLVNIEAMAMGKPVVAFTKGGIKEIIRNKENGVLVADTSAEDLAKELSWLIENNTERIRIGGNARNTVENNFTYRKVANDLRNVYAGLFT